MTSIADRYAALKYQQEAIETELKALRAEIIATGREVVEGEQCKIVVSLSERVTLDSKLARQFLTLDQVKACEKTSLIETLRIKAKVAA
jgi:hypothetical protein